MELGEEVNGRPNDERRFIHKKLLGGFSSIAGLVSTALPIPGLGIAGKIAGAFAGRGRGRATLPRTETARVTPASQAEKRLGRNLKFPGFVGGGGGPDGCPPGMRPDFQTGQCEAAGGQAVGEAIMGRYGAGLLPGSMIIDRAVCLKGMQLGDDGVCYNKSQISNKQRAWPAGRKPLLSGGDMRAISTAARAGRRLEGATKRLQRMGMMKKPTSRRGPTGHQRLLEAHATK